MANNIGKLNLRSLRRILIISAIAAVAVGVLGLPTAVELAAEQLPFKLPPVFPVQFPRIPPPVPQPPAQVPTPAPQVPPPTPAPQAPPADPGPTIEFNGTVACYVPLDGHRHCTCIGRYDSDSLADACSVDMDTGVWSVALSTGLDSSEVGLPRGWRWPGWQPTFSLAPGDYNNDGITEPAVVDAEGRLHTLGDGPDHAPQLKTGVVPKLNGGPLDIDGDRQEDRILIDRRSGRFVAKLSGSGPTLSPVPWGMLVSSWVGNFLGVGTQETLILERGEFWLRTPPRQTCKPMVAPGVFPGLLRVPCVPERVPGAMTMIGRLDNNTMGVERLYVGSFDTTGRLSLAAYDPLTSRWMHGTVFEKTIRWTATDDPDRFQVNVKGPMLMAPHRDLVSARLEEGTVVAREVAPLTATRKQEIHGSGLIMRTTVTIDPSRRLNATTQTEQRTWLRGATGAVQVQLMRGDDVLWASKLIWPLGVEAKAFSWIGGPSTRFDRWDEIVPEHILEQSNAISIQQFHLPKETGLADLGQKIKDLVDTIKQFFPPPQPHP